MASKTSSLSLNPWEVHALSYEFTDHTNVTADGTVVRSSTWRQTQDPVIYPGIYSATGFDMMSILFQVMARPNPMIELGPVDCSVALIMCDLLKPDQPIVYVSDSFTELTGYARQEVLGRNCRFLQNPPSHVRNPARAIKTSDRMAMHRMRQAVHSRNEVQLEVTNYRKDGSRFTNALSIIPVSPVGNDYQYAVGFQVDIN